MGQGQAFLAEGQTYISCHTQGDAWQRVQGERSEYREMRRKEMVGTNHEELAHAF